jgi:tight adherence protein C
VLAGELELAVLETQAGKSLSAALHALADRCGVPDLSTLISALVQTERLGTRIADTLRVQADSMREKRLRLAEEIAQKAPVKMLFPAAFIFSAMLIVTIVPAVLGMVKAFSDQ